MFCKTFSLSVEHVSKHRAIVLCCIALRGREEKGDGGTCPARISFQNLK